MTNPLTGPNGATFVFGKQKGANEKTSNILEAGMVNYASVLEREYQITIKDRKGAGAAGADAIYPYGVDSIITTVNAPMELEEALERSRELFLNAARRMFRMLKVGVRLDRTVE